MGARENAERYDVMSAIISITSPFAVAPDVLEHRQFIGKVNGHEDYVERSFLAKKIGDVLDDPADAPAWIRRLQSEGLLGKNRYTSRQKRSILVIHVKHNDLVEAQNQIDLIDD